MKALNKEQKKQARTGLIVLGIFIILSFILGYLIGKQ